VRLTPNRILLFSFIALILTGAGALMLPGSSAGQPLRWDQALFTSTSAVCVTGLTVIDTGKDFSVQGQIILLALIQLGGLGFLTFSSWFLVMLGKRLSLRGADTFSSSFGIARNLRLRDMLPRILIYTFVVEGIGAFLLWARFAWRHPPLEALGYAVFHSISAFCNAGFSLYSDNVMSYRRDLLVNAVIPALILFGGIGFLVQAEVMLWWRERRQGRRHRLSLHTRLVLLTSLLLILYGMLGFAVLEGDNTLRAASPIERMFTSWFQSVTCRTAGFNTVDIGALSGPTLCLMIFLMFIGASPGSCGGGVKTTTLGVLVALVLSRLHGRESADIFGRRIPSIQVAKALATLAAALGILAAASFAIQFTEYFVWGAQGVRERFLDYLFEVVSALGTVGLSTGITPTLSVPGRMVIVITMLAGRLGPLSVAVSLVGERKSARYEFPEESVMVG